MEFSMSRIHFDQDIQPLSEFRAGVAVVLDVAEYEAMQEKIELLEEMRTAEAQLASGLGVSNDDARAQVLGRIKK
ncbi:prevent-host-death family protein [Vibrio alginolyticus]|nr:prevent-host-death family protein [Vibrio alginolyticus]